MRASLEAVCNDIMKTFTVLFFGAFATLGCFLLGVSEARDCISLCQCVNPFKDTRMGHRLMFLQLLSTGDLGLYITDMEKA